MRQWQPQGVWSFFKITPEGRWPLRRPCGAFFPSRPQKRSPALMIKRSAAAGPGWMTHLSVCVLQP